MLTHPEHLLLERERIEDGLTGDNQGLENYDHWHIHQEKGEKIIMVTHTYCWEHNCKCTLWFTSVMNFTCWTLFVPTEEQVKVDQVLVVVKVIVSNFVANCASRLTLRHCYLGCISHQLIFNPCLHLHTHKCCNFGERENKGHVKLWLLIVSAPSKPRATMFVSVCFGFVVWLVLFTLISFLCVFFLWRSR